MFQDSKAYASFAVKDIAASKAFWAATCSI
jgi:hypothetical protein